MLTDSRPLISIVTETFFPDVNGVAHTLGILSDHLSERYRVQVVRSRQPDMPATLPMRLEHHIEVRSAPIPGYPEMRFGFPCGRLLFKTWQRERPQAVYVATQGPLGWSAVRAANKLGIPVTSGFHTNFHSYSSFYGFGWLQRLISGYLRLFHRQTRRTLVPTSQTAGKVRAIGITNTSIWSRGVDCEAFSPARRDEGLRASWGVKATTPVFLYIGRIAAEKNVDLAVQAFRRLSGEAPDARMVMVGDGPQRASLAARHPDILFTGIKRGEDLARHYASADVFLFPSETDTFGNVVLEAMASGLAIVSFDDAAAREHLTHEKSALLAAPGQYDTFCRLALTLAMRPGLLRQLGEAARRRALTLNWPSIAETFANLILDPLQEEETHGIPESYRRLPASR